MPNTVPSSIPAPIADALNLADPSWRPVLIEGLQAMAAADPSYLPALAADDYLPTRGRLFAAFAIALDAVRYVLVGEGPYPREESATGVCFMDGAVQSLWSAKGLSRQVNRATSLRNFMKMLLLADGMLAPDNTSGEALAQVAASANAPDSPLIQTLPELQANLTRQGFLLLNASLVYRAGVAPQKDAKAWRPLMNAVLAALLAQADRRDRPPPTLVLWGKIAEQLHALPTMERFPKQLSEHPYNLSFILNPVMRELFGPMQLLRKHD